MKIQKLFWTLMVMALPLGFTSCGDDDDEIGNTSYQFDEAPQKSEAAAFEVKAPSSDTRTRGVVFAEGGDCVIKQVLSPVPVDVRGTRAGVDEELVYIIGTYTKDGDVYTIRRNGQLWGTVTVNVVGGVYVLIIQEVGQPVEEAEAVKTPEAPASNMTDLLCRSWKPFRTRLNLKKEGSTTTIADELEGADFEKLKARINKESSNPSDPSTWIIKDGFGEGYNVSSIFFTLTGTFCIAFEKAESYVGQWKWNGAPSAGNLTYEWDDPDKMKNDYENGTAHVDIYEVDVYKGECWLRLLNDITVNKGTPDEEKWHVEIVFRLRP